jgi:hypothetical protein
LALSVFGEVWSFGASDFGQLGHGNIVDIRLPTPILPQRHNIPANVRQICAGYTFSMAATDTGEVYSWGQGESGELGHAAKILMYAPTHISDLRDVKYIAAGHRHAAAVTFQSQFANIASGGQVSASAAGDDAASKAGGDGKSRATASRRSVTTGGASSRGGSSRGGTSVASSDNTSVTGSRRGSRSNKSGTHRLRVEGGGWRLGGAGCRRRVLRVGGLSTRPRILGSPRGFNIKSGAHRTGQATAVPSRKQTYALVWGEDTCGQLGMRGLQAARSPTLLRDMAVVLGPRRPSHTLSMYTTPDARCVGSCLPTPFLSLVRRGAPPQPRVDATECAFQVLASGSGTHVINHLVGRSDSIQQLVLSIDHTECLNRAARRWWQPQLRQTAPRS